MSYFVHLPDWHIPSGAWAIVGSIIALTGVYITNRHSRSQLRTQLDHNAYQEDRKRAMQLRRDVYLPAAEAIMRSNSLIGKMADLDANEADLGQTLQECFATLAKTHVVGSPRTVSAVLAYQAAVTKAFMELLVKRLRLKIQLGEIRNLQHIIDNEVSRKDRCLSQMETMRLSPVQDQYVFDQLGKQFEEAQARQLEILALMNATQGKHAIEHLEFTQDVAARGVAIATLLAPTVVAVRAELELPINEVEYIRMFNDNAQMALDLTEALARELRQFHAGSAAAPKP